MVDLHGYECGRCKKEINVDQLLTIFAHRGEIYVMQEFKGYGTFRNALCPACTMKLIEFMKGE